MRAFLAIPVTGPDIEKVRTELYRHSCLRVTGENSVHMTFIFFQDLNPEKLEEIEDKMRRFHVDSSVMLKLSGPECFPNRNKCRIVVMRDLLDDSARLYERIEREIIKNPENRAFLPHVTVARVKGNCDLQFQKRAMEIKAETLDLFQSELRPDGPVYSKLREIQLM